MSKEKPQPFSQHPTPRTAAELNAAEQQKRDGTRILQVEFQGQTSYVHQLTGEPRPITILNMADMHWGADATDYESIIALRDYALENPLSVKILLCGDELEGIVQKYLSTNAATSFLDFQQQTESLIRNFIKPLTDKEDEVGESIILGEVIGYFAHVGSAQETTTLQVWRNIVANTDIPLIQQGGIVGFVFPESDDPYSILTFHYTPGKPGKDLVNGSREALSGFSASARPEAVLSGHFHVLAASQENLPPEHGRNYHSTYLLPGTAKGSNPELPRDLFGIKISKSLTPPLGAALLTYPTENGTSDYATASLKHEQVSRRALEVLNAAESQGLTNELMERIHTEVQARPKVDFVVRLSERDGQPYEEISRDRTKDGKPIAKPPRYPAKQWHEVRYNMTTKLPVLVFPTAHIRTGSSSTGEDRFQSELVAEIAADPHKFLILLGRIIDAEVPGDPNREAILNQLVSLISPIKDQTLAILHNRVMRDSRWKSPIGSGRLQVPEIAAGDFLSRNLNTPLVHHRSSVSIGVGPKSRYANKPEYTTAVLDELDGHASRTKHTFGQHRVYDLHIQEKPGIVAGGHMPNSGYTVFYDPGNTETHYPILIAPGWYAKYCDTIGDGNTSPGAEPGQGVILMPGLTQDDYLAFPTRNMEQSLDLHTSLTLLKGLQQLGIPLQNILSK